MAGKKRPIEQRLLAHIIKDPFWEIRELALLGIPQSKIAKIYGICQPHVSDIVTRKHYNHF